MAAIDPTKKANARKLFPAFSERQFDIFIHFCFGLTRKSIAALEGVSVQAVQKSLKECCAQCEVNDPELLRYIFVTRLALSQL